MSSLSIHFNIPEVITCLSTLFLLGTSHAAACFPVCRDVYLAEASIQSGCGLIFTSLTPPVSLSLEGTPSHCYPHTWKSYLVVLFVLFPTFGLFKNTLISSNSESSSSTKHEATADLETRQWTNWRWPAPLRLNKVSRVCYPVPEGSLASEALFCTSGPFIRNLDINDIIQCIY